MRDRCAAWAFALGVALVPTAVLATETDQFTLPPKPLDDLGRTWAPSCSPPCAKPSSS